MAERIIDASSLINLYASGAELRVLEACGRFFVSEEVQAEALTIRQPDPDDPEMLVPAKIDLSIAVSQGLIAQFRLEGPDELDAFVQFAVELDDGEASCLAIAQSRGWKVATDDRKAARVASAAGIAVITTPELIQQWVAVDSPDDPDIAQVLRRIERFARFRPRRSSPHYGWWSGLSDEGA
jgi:predicted nucleic acid-binding protein